MSKIQLIENKIITPAYIRQRGHPTPPIVHGPGMGIQGECRAILYNRPDEMNIMHDSGWQPNKILDTGLDLFTTTSNWGRYLHIWNGTTPPTAGDAGMESQLASTQDSGVDDGLDVNNLLTPYEYSDIKSKRFDAGEGTGLISEAGLSNVTGATGLFNRVLLDTPINKQAINVLDVMFRITIWRDLTDTLNTITIDDLGVPENYNTIVRQCDVDNFLYITVFAAAGASTTFNPFSYDGNIGAITGFPSGGSSGSSNDPVNESYTPGSHYRDMTISNGITQFNAPLGIRSIFWRTKHATLQAQFNRVSDDARIGKNAERTLDLTLRVSWAEHTP